MTGRQAMAAAMRTWVVALLLFGPLTGLVLSGYGVVVHWERPVWIASGLAVGHLLFGLLTVRPWGRVVRWWLRVRHHLPTTVAREGVESPPLRRVWWWLPLPILLLLPFFLSKYWLNVAILGLIYVLLGLGLNIVVGLAGLLDLGFVAFYAVGAYSYALGHLYLGLNFWQALPFGALLAALFGVVLGFPVLRMHGDYLAIVTLGFGEIIRLILNNWGEFTRGPNGVKAPFPTLFNLDFARQPGEGLVAFHQWAGIDYSPTHRAIFLYLVLGGVVTLAVWLSTRLRWMPLGRAWEALREDEIACRSLGINHVTVKLSAFSLGAMSGGVGGVFFAASQGFVNPTSFSFFESALILAIVVLGGMGSTPGVIAAALVVTILPEVLRDFADYRVLVFGIGLVVMMIWRPAGFAALRPRRPGFPLVAPLRQAAAGQGAVATEGASRGEKLLEVRGLTRRFGGIAALNQVDLTVNAGSITALIGPNGAGKTTVFNCLTGFYPVDAGSMLLHREGATVDLRERLGASSPLGLRRGYYTLFGGSHQVVRAGVVRTFQNVRLFREMTVLENLLVAQHGQVDRRVWSGVVGGRAYRQAEERALSRAREELANFGLLAEGNRLAGELPYGWQRRLEIVRALCVDPCLLCLDEPAAGLNPRETRELGEMIQQVRTRRGVTVLLIEHDMELVMELSDWVVVLDHGEVIARGSPAVVRRDPLVLEAYLGGASA